MKFSHSKIWSAVAIALPLGFLTVWESTAQDQLPSIQQVDQETSTPPGMSPEQAKIWNSPRMVKARAWLETYCKRSARISPEEAKQYMNELEKLTPVQMKLWLLKFDHEEEQRQRQYQAWEKIHHAALQHALAMQQETQAAYADINRDESEKAETEEGELNQERSEAFQMEEGKSQDLDTPAYGAFGYETPFYGGYPGYGGIHYHFHLPPQPVPR